MRFLTEQPVIYLGLPVWATVVLTILAILLGLILGLVVTGLVFRLKLKPKPNQNEKLLRALGKELGRPFSQQQINMMLKQMKKGK